MILLIGSEGSMGKRYQAILKNLDETVECFDFGSDLKVIKRIAKYADRIIIASPTSTHYHYVSNLIEHKRPILCEKPLSKDPSEYRSMIDLAIKHKTPLSMMMQYRFLINNYSSADSYYDYFRHGNDGIVWDCMQIIALARGRIFLREESPVWKCQINGRELNYSDMDSAYVSAVAEWIEKPYSMDLPYLLEAHEKTNEYLKKYAS